MNDREAIELLEAMVRISSLSGQEANLAAFLVETMNRLGFTQAFVDEAGNAVGVQGSGFRVQGLKMKHLGTILIS